MAMHCGPVRHTMTAPAGSALRALSLIVHETAHQAAEGEHIQTTFRGIVEDDHRTALICDDVAAAARTGGTASFFSRAGLNTSSRSQRRLADRGIEVLVLHGQIGKEARNAVVESLDTPPTNAGLVLAATASPSSAWVLIARPSTRSSSRSRSGSRAMSCST